MVSIQVDSNGLLYYAARLNYKRVKMVNNDELEVDYDMVSVRYKLDDYNRIIYLESSYLPYHQHGKVQVYSGDQAANALTVMGPELLRQFVADLVDLYNFFYSSTSDNRKRQIGKQEPVQAPTPTVTIKTNECSSCKCKYEEGQRYCSRCGRLLTALTDIKSIWHVKCNKCKRVLPSDYVDAQNVFCPYCGSKNISYFQ